MHTCLSLEYFLKYQKLFLHKNFHLSKIWHLSGESNVIVEPWARCVCWSFLGYTNCLQILGLDHVRISCDIFGSMKRLKSW